MRILFNEGISNQFGKKKTHAKSAADAMGITRTNEELAKLLEEMSSDDESEDDENEYNKQSYNTNDDQDQSLEVIEIFREKTIEDIIEEQREKLAAQGKVGTPVTAESFAKWRAEKLAKRQADAEARMKLEQSKKKGSKGLCKYFIPCELWMIHLIEIVLLICIYFFIFYCIVTLHCCLCRSCIIGERVV